MGIWGTYLGPLHRWAANAADKVVSKFQSAFSGGDQPGISQSNTHMATTFPIGTEVVRDEVQLIDGLRVPESRPEVR